MKRKGNQDPVNDQEMIEKYVADPKGLGQVFRQEADTHALAHAHRSGLILWNPNPPQLLPESNKVKVSTFGGSFFGQSKVESQTARGPVVKDTPDLAQDSSKGKKNSN